MRPLLFGALPPPAATPPAAWEPTIDALRPLARLGATALVPEVLDGAYRTVEPRAFAAALQRRLGVRAAVNRITVHHPAGHLEAWAAETWRDHGLRDLVLVGGERTQPYPGPGVPAALRLLGAQVRARGGSLGAVTIPTRRRAPLDEPERLLAKQEAGATYAVSQILCESASALRLQRDLAGLAARRGRDPLPILWSLAPVARPRDVAFLRWLGVHVPPDAEARLLAAPSPEARLAASHALNLATAREVLEDAEELGVRAGFCVEHVMQGNVPAALDLLEQVAELARSHRRQLVA